MGNKKLLKAGVLDILHVLKTGEMPDSWAYPYPPKVKDILLLDEYQEAAEDIIRLSPPYWRERFNKSLLDFYMHQVSAATQELPNFSSCEELGEFRKSNSGLYHTTDFIEFCVGAFLTPESVNDAVLKEMRSCVMFIAAISNDIFSFEKETMRDGLETQVNMVYFAMHHERLSLRKAVARTAKMVHAQLMLFFELKEKLTIWHQPNVPEYVQALQDHMLGWWPWQLDTVRYRSATSPFAELVMVPPKIDPAFGWSADGEGDGCARQE